MSMTWISEFYESNPLELQHDYELAQEVFALRDEVLTLQWLLQRLAEHSDGTLQLHEIVSRLLLDQRNEMESHEKQTSILTEMVSSRPHLASMAAKLKEERERSKQTCDIASLGTGSLMIPLMNYLYRQ